MERGLLAWEMVENFDLKVASSVGVIAGLMPFLESPSTKSLVRAV